MARLGTILISACALCFGCVVGCSSDSATPSMSDAGAIDADAEHDGSTLPSDITITDISPRELPARGGELTLMGEGLDRLTFLSAAGSALEILSAAPDELRVRVPQLPPGLTSIIVVDDGGAQGIFRDAFTVLPQELAFEAQTEAGLAAEGAFGGTSIAALDLDDDGALDLLVGTASGVFAFYGAGDGTWALFEDEAGPVDVTALAGVLSATSLSTGYSPVQDNDFTFVCLPEGHLRTLILGGSEAAFETASIAGARDACVAVAAGNTGTDGELEFHELIAFESRWVVRGWTVISGGMGPRNEGLRVFPEEVPEFRPIGGLEGAELHYEDHPESPLRRMLTTEFTPDVDGAGIEIDFPLPPYASDAESSITLSLSFDGVANADVVLIDADGRSVTVPVDTASGTRDSMFGPIDSLTADGTEEPLSAPVSLVRLRMRGSASTPLTLQVLDGQASSPTGRFWTLGPFEVREGIAVGAGTPTSMVSADLEADGQPELLVAVAGEEARVVRMTPGEESHPSLATLPSPASSMAVLDVNLDGYDDLLVGQAEAPDILLINDGSGELTEDGTDRLPFDSSSASAFRVADFDLDGIDDVFVAVRDGADRLYRGTSEGRFIDLSARLGLFEDETVDAVVFDANQDGALDVVTVDSAARLRIYLAVEPEVSE